MKIYIKVALAFFLLLLGTILLINKLATPLKKSDFLLVKHIQEGDLAYHTNAIQLINQIQQYNAQSEKSLTQQIVFSTLKDELLNAGLRLEHTYFTYSFKNSGMATVYIEIKDTAKFNSAFKKLSTYFDLQALKTSEKHYISPERRISIEKHPKYVKMNFGFITKKALLEEGSNPSLLFQQLLKNPNNGVINTTGTQHLDPANYAIFNYTYNKTFNLNLEWKTQNSPLQKNKKDAVLLYPSAQNKLSFFSNIDIQHLQKQLPTWQLEKSKLILDNMPLKAKEILRLWNGIATLQLGGKVTQKSTQYLTEFDENFNPIEKKVVRIDSLFDLGFYWGTNYPEKTLQQLKTFKNVELKNDELQIALLPALKVQINNNNLQASSLLQNFKEINSKELLFASINIPGLEGEISVKKSSEKTVSIYLQVKDWRLLSSDKKLKFSMFW